MQLPKFKTKLYKNKIGCGTKGKHSTKLSLIFQFITKKKIDRGQKKTLYL